MIQSTKQGENTVLHIERPLRLLHGVQFKTSKSHHQSHQCATDCLFILDIFYRQVVIIILNTLVRCLQKSGASGKEFKGDDLRVRWGMDQRLS